MAKKRTNNRQATNQSGTRTSFKEKRRPKTAETFLKHFPTFEDALDALKNINSDIEDIIGDATTIPEAIANITNDYCKYIPDLIGKENIYTSLSSSVNRLSYKLDTGYAFGWNIKYRVVEGTATIDDVEVIIKVFKGNEDLKDYLGDWEYIM